jgi:predicted RNA-binding Zn ribbon-like protein
LAGPADRRLRQATLRALKRESEADPHAATRALRETRDLREALFAMLTALIRNDAAPVEALSCLEKHWQSAVAHARLSVASGHVRPQLSVETSGLGYFNHELALRSFELLQTVPLERTRVCPGPRCGWVFIDRSKGGQRRWCDMATCGNAAKSRSHYQRKRQARRHT